MVGKMTWSGWYQQHAKQREEELGGRPLRQVEGGEQVLDKVVKQGTKVILIFTATASGERDWEGVRSY